VLRIHFTSDDLSRIRVVAEPHPVQEVLLSQQLLQNDHGSPLFDEWRRRVRATGKRLTFPDSTSFQAHIREYHDVAVKPYWQVIRSHIRADRDKRAGQIADGGVENLLVNLHPAVEWITPILHVDSPDDRDLRLAGHGLVLAPSFFCWQTPIVRAEPGKQPVLVYPVEHTPDWIGAPAAPRPGSLTALLGRTRAAVLRSIAEAPFLNTSQLAQATGISLAGASQHAAVLRDAGLVVTLRQQGSARHKLSERGATLLDG
jgi:DNA-binding transcriptional ArsR family regulator